MIKFLTFKNLKLRNVSIAKKNRQKKEREKYLFQSIIECTKDIGAGCSLASKSRNLVLPRIIVILIDLDLKI